MAVSGGGVAVVEQLDDVGDDRTPRSWPAWGSIGAVVGLTVFVLASLGRNGVEALEIVRFSGYVAVAVLAPGLVVSRATFGVGRTRVEDLSIAAATGLSLEVLSIALGMFVGLADLSRFWWLPVILVGVAVPAVRVRVLARVPEPMPLLHATALAVLTAVVLMRLDLQGFRTTPLPPSASSINQDVWWHLALVQEMMRFERPQVPQIVGEPLNYHFFSHLHLAAGTKLSGVAPEVVLFRLWLVPMVLVSVGLAYTLGRSLTSSRLGGIATAWLGYGVVLQRYLWLDLSAFGSHPLAFTSPSQVFGNVMLLASALAFVQFVRAPLGRRQIGWLLIVVAGAGGSKSTIIPLFIAATAVVVVVALVRRAEAWKRALVALGALLGLQVLVLLLAAARGGGKIILLGTLKSLAPYRELVPDSAYRALNDGLVLDSISSPRTAALAAVSVVVFYGLHAIRLAGLTILGTRAGRADLAVWWLAGAVVAGYAASLVIDHVGLSQVWFVLTAAPLGAALTVHAFLTFARGRNVSLLAAIGLGLGIVIALAVEFILRVRRGTGGDGAGALENALLPILVVVAFAGVGIGLTVGAIGWARCREVLPALTLAAVVGISVPSQAEYLARSVSDWIDSVPTVSAEEAGDYVTEGELAAMLWLREQSADSDVIATNVNCRPVRRQFAPCDARGFWVVGLSGRRAVLEGFAYTAAAQRLQGVDGRVWSLQPTLFTEREELNDAMMAGDEDALRALVDGFGLRWIVVVHRASATPDFSPFPAPVFDESVARVRFENREVTILEVVGTS